MKIPFPPSFVASLLALLACSGAHAHPGHSHAPKAPARPATTSTARLILGEKDAGRTFKARVGDQITVKLGSNASTGFSWEMAPSNGKVLVAQGKGEYLAPVQAVPMPGAPGSQIFRFKALKPGKSKIELRYRRNWEKVAPGQIWTATINVR